MEFDFFEMSRHLERVNTARLALRPAALSDAWPLFGATRNPRFNRHLAWEAPETIDPMLERMEAIVQASRFGSMSAFSAVCRETGAFVGMLRYMRHESRAGALEMGVWLSDRYWHGRIGQELGALALNAAFELTSVDRLCGMARPENRSSCALMAGLGMVAQPDLQTYPLEAGGEVVVREFMMTRQEWASRDWRAFEYYGLDQTFVSRGAVAQTVAAEAAPADDAPPRMPEARRLALEALRTAAATAASSTTFGLRTSVAAPEAAFKESCSEDSPRAAMPEIDAQALGAVDLAGERAAGPTSAAAAGATR